MGRPVLVVLGLALGAVVLLLVVAAIAVFTVDPNTLAGPVQERIKAATGRDLQIGGGIDLKLSLTPRLEVRDVTLANAPWGKSPSLVAAKRLEIELALLPLLRRQLDIRHITLVGPSIALETDASGRGNWELGRADAKPAEPASRGAQNLGGALVGIGDVEIADGNLSYRNGRSGSVVQVKIDKLEVHARDLSSPVNAQFRGVVDGVPIALTGNAGPLLGFVQRGEPVQVGLDGDIAARKVKVEGKLASRAGVTSLSDLRARLGASELTGSLEAASDNGRTRLGIRLVSSRLALADVPLPVATAAAAPRAAAPTVAPAIATHVLSDTPLPLEALRDTDLDVDLRAAELVTADAQRFVDVHVALTARAGRVDMPELTLALFGGRVRATVHADVRADVPSVHLEVAADDLELGQIVASTGHAGRVTGGKTQVRGDVATRGTSLHAWAAGANGVVTVNVGPAGIGGKQQAATGAMLDLLTAILPAAGVGDINELRCAVVRLPIAGGIARVQRSIGLETNRLGLIASGTIDLRNESVDLLLRPVAAGGGPLDVVRLVGAVRWQGPWRQARFGIDPVAAVTSPDTLARLGASLLGGGSLANTLRAVAPAPGTEPGACTTARAARVS